MKLSLLAVGVLALAVLGTSSPITKDLAEHRRRIAESRDIDANAFVDAVLEVMREKAIEYGMDPMKLPDELHGFSVEWLFVTYHGEMEFTKGWLQNLSTIYRSGDSEVVVTDGIMDIKTEVQFDQLFLTYEYLAKIMNVGPIGDLIGKVDDLKFSVNLLFDTATCKAILKDIYISDHGRLDIKLDGTWFFDVIWNAMIDMFTWIFDDTILGLVENKIREAIETTLPGLEFGDCSAIRTLPAMTPPQRRH